MGTATDVGVEPERYFFMHIPKTAGMTLYHRLVRCHGKALYPLPPDRGRLDAAADIDHLRRCFATHRSQIRVVVGHFPRCIDEVLGVPLTTFTLLRNPVDRTLSLLRQHKQQDQGSRYSSLEDVYANPVLLYGLIRNFMVKCLTATVDEIERGVMTMVQCDEGRLERAKHLLEHRIELFGLQEDFDTFCEELSSRFGWDLGDGALLANQTSAMDVSDDLRERIAHDSALDMQLYRFARDLLERRRSNDAAAAVATPLPIAGDLPPLGR
jgi:Sulfotransferase family